MITYDSVQQQKAKNKDLQVKLNKKLAKQQTINFQLSTEQIQEMIRQHQDLYYGISTFEFNIFEFSDTVGRNMQMPFIATALMELNGVADKIDKNKYLQFIVQIYNGYDRSVEYHNDLHGSDVAQHCHYILQTQNLAKYAQFNDLDTISLLVSALCHDVGHDGYNNKYHVVTNSDRYLMFGDSNVQESYHAAETLKLLNLPEYDFISSHFTQEDTQLFRKRIVDTILHTDIAQMKNLRNQLSQHMEKFQIQNGNNTDCLIDTSTNKSKEDSKQLMANSILHACDISTSLREFEVSTQWADLLFEEFFNQGDMEKSMDLDVSMLCDRETTQIAGGQSGYISFVVTPIFEQLAQISPVIKDVQLTNAKQNVEKWNIRAEAEKKQREREMKMKALLQNASSINKESDQENVLKTDNDVDGDESEIAQTTKQQNTLTNEQDGKENSNQ